MSTFQKKRKYYQRKYQKTRYQIPNVIVPDELVMKIKRNWHFESGNALERTIIPINGIRKSDFPEYFNLAANMQKFKQIEYLSGKVTIYVRPYYEDTIWLETNTLKKVNDMMIGYFTARQWVDESLELQNEIVIPKQDNYASMWRESGETPGYGIKFIKNAYNDKRHKFGFKGSKKDWKTLKANRTGFQDNLPLDTTTTGFSPQNIKLLHLDYTEVGMPGTETLNGSRFIFFCSHTVLVRFKGRTEL
ncbi:hypothetical protein [Circo-like virus-Brazil hs2]|nr:hypothetical protein [Circo-like virus-Brazil hs2]